MPRLQYFSYGNGWRWSKQDKVVIQKFIIFSYPSIRITWIFPQVGENVSQVNKQFKCLIHWRPYRASTSIAMKIHEIKNLEKEKKNTIRIGGFLHYITNSNKFKTTRWQTWEEMESVEKSKLYFSKFVNYYMYIFGGPRCMPCGT